MKKHEENLQIQVCRYIAMQYPGIIFMSDVASGLRLSIGQAVKAKKMRSSRGQPDLFIAEPKFGTSQVSPAHHLMFHHMYCAGLFLELKKEGARIFKKDGSAADAHIREQSDLIAQLNLKGFQAHFAVGFTQAKELIDTYLK